MRNINPETRSPAPRSSPGRNSVRSSPNGQGPVATGPDYQTPLASPRVQTPPSRSSQLASSFSQSGIPRSEREGLLAMTRRVSPRSSAPLSNSQQMISQSQGVQVSPPNRRFQLSSDSSEFRRHSSRKPTLQNSTFAGMDFEDNFAEVAYKPKRLRQRRSSREPRGLVDSSSEIGSLGGGSSSRRRNMRSSPPIEPVDGGPRYSTRSSRLSRRDLSPKNFSSEDGGDRRLRQAPRWIDAVFADDFVPADWQAPIPLLIHHPFSQDATVLYSKDQIRAIKTSKHVNDILIEFSNAPKSIGNLQQLWLLIRELLLDPRQQSLVPVVWRDIVGNLVQDWDTNYNWPRDRPVFHEEDSQGEYITLTNTNPSHNRIAGARYHSYHPAALFGHVSRGAIIRLGGEACKQCQHDEGGAGPFAECRQVFGIPSGSRMILLWRGTCTNCKWSGKTTKQKLNERADGAKRVCSLISDHYPDIGIDSNSAGPTPGSSGLEPGPPGP